MNFDAKCLEPWEKVIPCFSYNSEMPFFEMLVPTTDTVRYGYLMEKLLSVNHSVLFTGITGVGKVRRVCLMCCKCASSNKVFHVFINTNCLLGLLCILVCGGTGIVEQCSGKGRLCPCLYQLLSPDFIS